METFVFNCVSLAKFCKMVIEWNILVSHRTPTPNQCSTDYRLFLSVHTRRRKYLMYKITLKTESLPFPRILLLRKMFAISVQRSKFKQNNKRNIFGSTNILDNIVNFIRQSMHVVFLFLFSLSPVSRLIHHSCYKTKLIGSQIF